MKKVFVSVGNCQPGMQIAENIFNEYGAIIIAENTILDDFIIERIKGLGLVKIKIFDHNDDMILVSGTELFRAQYNENRDIVNCINEMRETDEYLYTHSINVSFLAMLIGKWLKYDYYSIKSLVSAGFLHDIGKGRIDAKILSKPGALTKEEFEEMKKHPVYGFKLAEEMNGLNDDILKGILLHHERDDGSGYPFGMKGDQIHHFAKIIAVADTYDAMTSNRAYRHMECPFDVLEQLEKGCFGKLDHRVVNTFIKNIASYYMGDFVRLSTGEIGEIVYINPYNVSKPIVKTDDIYIDLANEKQVKILELI